MKLDNLKKLFTVRILILICLFAVGLNFALSESSSLWFVGTIILGAMFAHAVELQHQCLHYTAFRYRPLNRIVGIALGLPTLTSFHAYRRSHIEHHRNLGTSKDATFFVYRFLEEPTLKSFLCDLLGFSHLKASLSAVFGNSDSRLVALPQPANSECRDAERFDYGLMGFALVVGILYSMVFGFGLLFKVWLIPCLFVAQPIHFLIELPEHLGCPANTTDVFVNTRTIRGSCLSSWFTNYNNLHVEHHLDASIPMANLPYLFRAHAGKHHYYSESYIQFYKTTLHTVWSKNKVNVSNTTDRRSA